MFAGRFHIFGSLQRRIIDVVLVVATSLSLCATVAPAQTTKPAAAKNTVTDLIESGTDSPGEVMLMTNRSRVITASRPIKRVSVGQPETATVNPLSPTSLLITAKQAGNTQVIVWDEADRSQVLELTVGFDMKSLQDQLRELYPDADIQPRVYNGSITLTGRVPNLEVADQAEKMAAGYSNKVLNLLKIPQGGQVLLQVRFAEVSRQATSALGVNFAVGDGLATFGSNIGSPNTFNPGTPLGNITRSLPANATQFASGSVGSTNFELFITALRQNNLIRILAEPNLTAASGQEAKFLAGGDFPVPVAQDNSGGSSGSSAITVEYREFGVRLSFVPAILGDGRIRLKMSPEVSDVDYSNAVRSNGFLIPGRRTRNLTTTVELVSGQTFAVGGLLDNRVNASKDATPLLSDLPVLGPLFRSVRYQRNETELVVLVTPRIVAPLNPSQVPAVPGEDWRHPSEVDLFVNGDLGGPVPTTRPSAPPPLYMGQHGLVSLNVK